MASRKLKAIEYKIQFKSKRSAIEKARRSTRRMMNIAMSETLSESDNSDLIPIQIDRFRSKVDGEQAICVYPALPIWDFPRNPVSVAGGVLEVLEIRRDRIKSQRGPSTAPICIPSSVEKLTPIVSRTGRSFLASHSKLIRGFRALQTPDFPCVQSVQCALLHLFKRFASDVSITACQFRW
jgi:hypothetical protein